MHAAIPTSIILEVEGSFNFPIKILPTPNITETLNNNDNNVTNISELKSMISNKRSLRTQQQNLLKD